MYSGQSGQMKENMDMAGRLGLLLMTLPTTRVVDGFDGAKRRLAKA